MIDPFESHPEIEEEVSKNKKLRDVSIEEIKEAVEQEIDLVMKEQTPMWGYNKNHIKKILSKLINEISKIASEKDDS